MNYMMVTVVGGGMMSVLVDRYAQGKIGKGEFKEKKRKEI